MNRKTGEATGIIRQALKDSQTPVVLYSFGKDSTVVLHMVSQLRPDVEILFLMGTLHGKSLKLNRHIIKMIIDRGLDVYTYPPTYTGYVQKGKEWILYHVHYVDTGSRLIVAKATEANKYGGRGNFMCAISDWLMIPTVGSYSFKWDCVFSGYRRSDDEHRTISTSFEQQGKPINLLGYGRNAMGQPTPRVMACPLHNWIDADVWAYLEAHNLPHQKDGYIASGNDLPTCYRCLDLNNSPTKTVVFPRCNREIPFAGKSKEMHEREIEVGLKMGALVIRGSG